MSQSIHGALGGHLITSCGPVSDAQRYLRVDVEHTGRSVAIYLDWNARQDLIIALQQFDSHEDESD
jgi:hypothetical protein